MSNYRALLVLTSPLEQAAQRFTGYLPQIGIYFIGMGNFPRNCPWMKLEIGNFDKIVFGNPFISKMSKKKSKMFVDGHLEH
jgi:hypothetical protein